MNESRLSIGDEELASALASAPEERRAIVAAMAVGAAFTHARMTEPFVRETSDGLLEPGDRVQLEAQQAEAEEAYLQLHEQFQTSEGLRDKEEQDRHLLLFARARALQAALYLADREFDEAVYEALHASTDEQASAALLRRLIQAAS